VAAPNSEIKQVELGQGTVRYRDAGAGEPVLFVHGLLVNGSLWRKVTPSLEGDFRCIVPDWPLGSHSPAMHADAELSPLGLARVIDDFMTALDLDGVTLVGNDTGGAICQLVAAHHPDRIGRLVLTPCDAYENFLPPFFRPLQWLARVPGALAAALQPTRLHAIRRSPLAFGLLCKHGVDREASEGWARPSLEDRAVRRDSVRVLRGIDKRYTLEAAELLRQFDRPTLIAWAPEDRFFKLRYAERLAEAIPNARLELIEDSYSFVPEDQPERLAELIAEFIGSTQPARPTASSTP
jgi:pimeloyl-ACP methyl ester carboxylesterase